MLLYINRKNNLNSDGIGLNSFLKNVEKHFLKTDMLDFSLGWRFNLHKFKAQRAHYQGGDSTCSTCGNAPETAHHLYFECAPLQMVLNGLINTFLPYIVGNFEVGLLLDGVAGICNQELALFHILLHAFFYYVFLVASRKLRVNQKAAEMIVVSTIAIHLEHNRSLKNWFNTQFFRLQNLERWLQRASFI